MQTLPTLNEGWTRLRLAVARGLRPLLGHGLFVAGRRSPAVDSGRVMGTYFVTTLGRRPLRSDSGALHRKAREQLCQVEALMSMYLTQSDVGRFNAAAHNDWIDVSPPTIECVRLAMQIGRESGGLFDITAGPLVKLWGFGPGQGWQGVPRQSQIEEARSRVGLDQLEVREHPPAIRKHDSTIELDLSSIAKGFAVDLACETLDGLAVRDYCVEVGGEIRTMGRNARGVPWQIAIETPSPHEPGAHCIVPLSGLAMATSGDYRIYSEQDGVRYPHVIDPRTGWPVGHNLASVTVVDTSCARADGWATALMVAGPHAGFELARKHGIRALFITRTDQGFIETQTETFPASVDQARA